MELLYSNILPLPAREGQQTFLDCFMNQISKADQIEIAVGYASLGSIKEIDELVAKYKISKVSLNIGMYFTEGMPENSYHTAIKINKKWQDLGIGEIRLVNAFKYHGKSYCFYKNGEPFSAIIGSANLGIIKLEASNRRQYEFSAITTSRDEVDEIAKHIEDLKNSKCSSNISTLSNIPLIHELNTALTGVELVTQVPKSNVDFYRQCKPSVEFKLLLKVPTFSNRLVDNGKNFTKSNINVCYAAPRSKNKSRDWYETQLTVDAEIYRKDGYPQKNDPFFVVTDDGYWFKAHTTSDNNKQFSAVGDELIMGRWLKSRLVAAGLVSPVNNTQLDTERIGMITKEILEAYGCDCLSFKKTGQTAIDENGSPLDVWLLSFESSKN